MNSSQVIANKKVGEVPYLFHLLKYLVLSPLPSIAHCLLLTDVMRCAAIGLFGCRITKQSSSYNRLQTHNCVKRGAHEILACWNRGTNNKESIYG